MGNKRVEKNFPLARATKKKWTGKLEIRRVRRDIYNDVAIVNYYAVLYELCRDIY